MNLTVVTVCSHQPTQPYYCLREFHETLKRAGMTATVLGSPQTYKGLISKEKLFRQHLLNGGVTTSHVIFCDSWDLVFADSMEGIMEKFFELKAPVVVSTEKDCWPLADLAPLFPETNTPYRYINGGFTIGETEAVAFMLECFDLDSIPDDYQRPDGSWEHSNDQIPFVHAFLKQPLKIALDSKAAICQTLSGAILEEFDFGGTKIRNRLTHQFPSSFHANGGGKTGGVMTRVLEHLRL